MKASLSLLASLPLLAAFAAGAQQLNQPNRIEPVQPLGSASQNSGNTLPQPAGAQNRAVPSDPAQRSQAPKIGSKGPATDAGKPAQPANTTPPAPARPLRVTDAQGRLVNGAVSMGNNRVMDPRTGKIYTTIAVGDGQRIVEPRPDK